MQAKCGHAVPFELYPDGADKRRESRRKLVIDRDCPDCRRKAGEAAEQEAARHRRADKARRPHVVVKDRLPHGSRHDVS